MTQDEFWRLVEWSGEGVSNPEVRCGRLTGALVFLGEAATVGFQLHMADMQARSYRADLWNLVYILQGGCSDDGFSDFRAWLIMQGRAPFEGVMSDPGELVAVMNEFKLHPCEMHYQSFAYVAMKAYEELTGSNWIPGIRYGPLVLEGDLLDDEEMKARHPDLWAQFMQEDGTCR